MFVTMLCSRFQYYTHHFNAISDILVVKINFSSVLDIYITVILVLVLVIVFKLILDLVSCQVLNFSFYQF